MYVMKLLRYYWFALAVTLVIWLVTGLSAGFEAFAMVATLTLLEITFSADNSVVNSKILATLSPFWQRLFMTLGVVFAVFVIRFIMPVVIVALTAKLGFSEVLHLAVNYPDQYTAALTNAEPYINAFGGTFLLLIALSYFIDYEKQTHWLGWLERSLGKLGAIDNVTTVIMLCASIVLYMSANPAHQAAVLAAAIWAMLLYNGLQLVDAFLHRHYKYRPNAQRTGWSALASFTYLLIIDAAFSLDGVIGAFALTNSIILIMAGLGAGAVWVRAITNHVIKAKTLEKYVYLEHGAHWAIGFLGAVMLLKLYDVNPPEWLVGSLGLVFISAAILTSRKNFTLYNQLKNRYNA